MCRARPSRPSLLIVVLLLHMLLTYGVGHDKRRELFIKSDLERLQECINKDHYLMHKFIRSFTRSFSHVAVYLTVNDRDICRLVEIRTAERSMILDEIVGAGAIRGCSLPNIIRLKQWSALIPHQLKNSSNVY